MNKRTRFAIIVAVLAMCFAFLWPSLRWYFFTPKEDQSLALGSREKIRDYARNMAVIDVKALTTAAKGGDTTVLGAEYAYLTKIAKSNYKNWKKDVPNEWTAAAVLSAFSSEADLVTAVETHYRERILDLKNQQVNAVQLGLDLSGGMSIIIKADLDAAVASVGADLTAAEAAALKEQAMEQVLETLSGRIDRFGLSEPVIRKQGSDRVYVEIPGAADSDRINSIIMGKGMLAFHLVDQEATAAFSQYYAQHSTTTFDANYNLLDPSIIPADCIVRGLYTKDAYGLDQREGFLVLKKEPALDGRHITRAMVQATDLGQPAVNFILDTEGTTIFADFTAQNIGNYLSIVSEDKVKSYAVIKDAIPTGSVQLSGFDAEEAQNIATVLRTAWLNVPLELENQQVIGASMGEKTIYQGMWALIVGLGLVMVFMILYYRAAGFNAVVAQILNLYIMFSILSAFNLTLSLSSIAGMILTIGMAVDANVLVFERIKEEMQMGKDRAAVINAGFDRAFWAVMDSNITTFIAAFFLSQIGSGTIQGFAISLAIGVISSVFTALFVSRLIFDFDTDVLKSKRVRISWRIK